MTQLVTRPVVQQQLLWLAGGIMLSFLVSLIFAGQLQLPRDVFLIPYVGIMSGFLYAFVRMNKVKLAALVKHKLAWGLLATIPVSLYAVQVILIQPSSEVPQGLNLAFDIFWSGIVYGGLDGILLSVFPVYIMWQVMKIKGWTDSGWKKKAAAGALALAASMVIIGMYHIGFPEFRGPQVMTVILGVGVMSLAYIVTGNPTVAVISHIVMHIAAVLQGAETMLQLPPHY
jgi:hypothetical protein